MDRRITYHPRPNDKPKGANACRNYGFELSNGKYINWFDSDDEMLPDKLEIQIKELHNSRFDYTICQTMMFDKDMGKELGLKSPNLTSENILEDYILFKAFWLIEAPLWKKSFLLENRLFFDENLHQSQDYDFHIRVLEKSYNYTTNNKVLVRVNSHEGNMSNSITDDPKKILSNIIVRDRILKKFRKKISNPALIIKYKEQSYFYKFCLTNNQIKTSLPIFKSLIQNINVLEIGAYKKLIFLTKLFLSLLSYSLFSKGEKLLKFNI